MNRIDWKRLETAARTAAEQAYCPYSCFRVGAALLTDDGSIITGCNIENASYGVSLCAERVAVAQAVAMGIRCFAALAIAAGESTPATPCGICRQMLAEFAPPELPIRCVTLRPGTARPARFTLHQLLPNAFAWNDGMMKLAARHPRRRPQLAGVEPDPPKR
jgi:cytidine deaminase